jgi:hypothetical protein
MSIRSRLVSHRVPAVIALVALLTANACTPGGSSPEVTSAVVASPDPPGQAATTPQPERTATAIPSVVASASPVATPAPSATPSPTTAPAAVATAAPAAEADPEPFAMNLASKRDFVAQYTFEWCVGASLQMAVNMATDDHRSSKADQGKLWRMARDRSDSPFGGANPIGWTATLNDLGIGPYELVSLPSFDEALTVAADAIRATRRPVGLVMWRGRHAWVMSGFEATADPRRSDTFDVTGIRVHDPLYPHGSSVWGKSPTPNSLVSPATLAEQFVIRDRGRVNLGVPPGWLLILPTSDEA